MTYGDTEQLKEKAVWFLRNQAPDSKKKAVNLNEQCDNDVIFGEITPNTIPQLNQMMENVYCPFITNLRDEDWNVCEEESKREF